MNFGRTESGNVRLTMPEDMAPYDRTFVLST